MLDYVGYIANVFIISAALTITLSPKLSLKPHLFVSFLIGHILWSIIAGARADLPLLILNVGFVLLDLVGIAMRTFLKNRTLFRTKP